MKKKNEFKWNVWLWDFNRDTLEEYDVIPRLLSELDRLPKKDSPKTKDEFESAVDSEARYSFWAKCEYEMIIHGWPVGKNDMKVDAYEQLRLNWDHFIEAFWKFYSAKHGIEE